MTDKAKNFYAEKTSRFSTPDDTCFTDRHYKSRWGTALQAVM